MYHNAAASKYSEVTNTYGQKESGDANSIGNLQYVSHGGINTVITY